MAQLTSLAPEQALDRWEERLEALFEGRPYDELDAALTDTCSRFPLHIQPFRDMIEGMRMDLVKSRYDNFDELYEYCYRVAGTVALMTTPIMGIEPSYKVRSLLVMQGWCENGSGEGCPGWCAGVQVGFSCAVGVGAACQRIAYHNQRLRSHTCGPGQSMAHPSRNVAYSSTTSLARFARGPCVYSYQPPVHILHAQHFTVLLQVLLKHLHSPLYHPGRCKQHANLSTTSQHHRPSAPASPLQGPLEPVYRAALALGTANQLTNILRDVGEDAYQRNRIYVPMDELDKFGISEKEVRCVRGHEGSS